MDLKTFIKKDTSFEDGPKFPKASNVSELMAAAVNSFGEMPEQKAVRVSDNEKQGQPQPLKPTAKLSFHDSDLKTHLKGFIFPPFLRPFQKDSEVMNFIYTSLSFFVNTTIKRPNPSYTWVDLPVPDQLIEKIGKVICIDGSTEGRIEIFH